MTLEDNNVLRITGERRREEAKEAEGYKRLERSYGSFERRFKVPSNADTAAIKADMAHGVLKISIPKREEQAKSKPVQISVGGAGATVQLQGGAEGAAQAKDEETKDQGKGTGAQE